MKKTTSNILFQYCLASLNTFEEGEKKAVAYILLEDAYGVSKTDILLNKQLPIDFIKLDEQLNQLNNKVPVQHLVGFTIFRNRKFSVSPDVLIPRPETEEIIDIIKGFGLDSPEVIDIGTGSGCIAISLALELNKPFIKAVDISERALAIAKKNATSLNASVTFNKEDFLNYSQAIQGEYDVVVSNPPYIKKEEARKMEDNVLHHEPHIALFVENKDPLVFYRHIAIFGKNNLKKGGQIVVEVNAHFGKETKTLFEGYGYSEVKLIQDFYEKDRFVVAKR
ncbi:MAG: release factor glutamine methyltransferase [Arcticibacterium sp.]|jgi:release factor glutamine methyltransferase